MLFSCHSLPSCERLKTILVLIHCLSFQNFHIAVMLPCPSGAIGKMQIPLTHNESSQKVSMQEDIQSFDGSLERKSKTKPVQLLLANSTHNEKSQNIKKIDLKIPQEINAELFPFIMQIKNLSTCILSLKGFSVGTIEEEAQLSHFSLKAN